MYVKTVVKKTCYTNNLIFYSSLNVFTGFMEAVEYTLYAIATPEIKNISKPENKNVTLVAD